MLKGRADIIRRIRAWKEAIEQRNYASLGLTTMAFSYFVLFHF